MRVLEGVGFGVDGGGTRRLDSRLLFRPGVEPDSLSKDSSRLARIARSSVETDRHLKETRKGFRPMNPKFLGLAAALLAVAGCTLTRQDVRRDVGDKVDATVIGQASGQVIEPKRCALKVVILTRPLHDRVVNESVWGAADEQVIAPEVRRGLEANGLRIGVITGALPAAVEGAVHAPPPDKVDPAEFVMPDGSNTLVSMAETNPVVSLLLNLDERASGRDYKEASGWFRVTANQDGATGVSLRFVPEIHHGPILRRYDSLPNGGAVNPMQFMLKDGQQEETLRDLLASLTLQPDQVVAIGCNPDRRGSLGSFLFTHPEANSDRLSQKIVLFWASRNTSGEPGSQPKASPKRTPRLVPVDPPRRPARQGAIRESGEDEFRKE